MSVYCVHPGAEIRFLDLMTILTIDLKLNLHNSGFKNLKLIEASNRLGGYA